jgi:hypothetical protein
MSFHRVLFSSLGVVFTILGLQHSAWAYCPHFEERVRYQAGNQTIEVELKKGLYSFIQDDKSRHEILWIYTFKHNNGSQYKTIVSSENQEATCVHNGSTIRVLAQSIAGRIATAGFQVTLDLTTLRLTTLNAEGKAETVDYVIEDASRDALEPREDKPWSCYSCGTEEKVQTRVGMKNGELIQHALCNTCGLRFKKKYVQELKKQGRDFVGFAQEPLRKSKRPLFVNDVATPAPAAAAPAPAAAAAQEPQKEEKKQKKAQPSDAQVQLQGSIPSGAIIEVKFLPWTPPQN